MWEHCRKGLSASGNSKNHEKVNTQNVSLKTPLCTSVPLSVLIREGNLMCSSAVVAHWPQCYAFRFVSVHHICKEWLFELLYPSCYLQPVWLFSSDLQNCHSLDVFCWSYLLIETKDTSRSRKGHLSNAINVNVHTKISKLLYVKISGDQQFLKQFFTQATNGHVTVEITEFSFLYHSDVWC